VSQGNLLFLIGSFNGLSGNTNLDFDGSFAAVKSEVKQ
jgi:hypothetical protein